MRKSLSLIFIICICFCSAQQPTITQLDNNVVLGKLIGLKGRHQFTNIRIKKNKRYRRNEYVYRGTLELSKGKWEIKNDTLILAEKFYKQKSYDDNRTYFFTFRKKIKRTTVTKLILYKEQWMEIEDGKYIAKLVYTQYVHKGITWERKDWVQRID